MDSESVAKIRFMFGIEPERLCCPAIISPFISGRTLAATMQQAQRFKGQLFDGWIGRYRGRPVAVVRTGIGAALTGDCLFALAAAGSPAAVFCGAAGACTPRYGIGQWHYVRAAAFVSNPGVVLHGGAEVPAPCPGGEPSGDIVRRFALFCRQQGYPAEGISVMSVQSLWQQDGAWARDLAGQGIDAVEMECALFYTVAQTIGISALALCYISDIVGVQPYWRQYDANHRAALSGRGADLLRIAADFLT